MNDSDGRSSRCTPGSFESMRTTLSFLRGLDSDAVAVAGPGAASSTSCASTSNELANEPNVTNDLTPLTNKVLPDGDGL